MNARFKRRTISIVTISAVLLLCFALSSPVCAETITLKMQSALPVTSNYYKEMVNCVETIKQRTGGEVVMNLFPPGALVKPLEILDSVKRGAVEGAISTGAYAVKKMPEGLVEATMPMSFTGPRFSYEAAAQGYEFIYEWRDGKILKIFQEQYAKHKIHLVGECLASSYGFMTTFPIERLEDMKGKKYRSYGLYSVMVKSLGASPTSIANSEQYMALQRGTVDGTVYTYSSLDTYNLKEVIKTVVFPPVMQTPSVNMIINMKVWNKISKENQQIINTAYREHSEKFSRIALEDEKRAIENAQKEGRINLVTLPPEDVQELKAAARQSWPIAAKKSETSAQLIDLLTEYLKEKGTY